MLVLKVATAVLQNVHQLIILSVGHCYVEKQIDFVLWFPISVMLNVSKIELPLFSIIIIIIIIRLLKFWVKVLFDYYYYYYYYYSEDKNNKYYYYY